VCHINLSFSNALIFYLFFRDTHKTRMIRKHISVYFLSNMDGQMDKNNPGGFLKALMSRFQFDIFFAFYHFFLYPEISFQVESFKTCASY